MLENKDNKPEPSKGLQERMQDVYFEFLPPIKESKEGKTTQEQKRP
jgi:hypothetical protein